MSNYALQLSDGSAHVDASGMTDIANATKLGITMSVLGDRFTTQPDGVERLIAVLAAGYLGVSCRINGISTLELTFSSVADGTIMHHSAGVAQSSYSATRYYRIRAYWDTTASPQQSIEIYDDTGTLVDSGTANVNTAISNGTFGLMALGSGGGFVSNTNGQTTEWLAAWNGAPPAGAPTMPSVGTSGLLRLWPCDDGSGTTVTESVDSSTGNATITGNFAWILLSSSGPNNVSDESAFSSFPTTLNLPIPAGSVVTVFG